MKDNKDEEKTLFQAIDAVDDKFLMETLKDMEKRKNQNHSTGKILMDFLGLDPTEYRKWAESNNQKNNDRDFWIEVIESRTIRRKKVC